MFFQCVINIAVGKFETVKRILEEEQESLKNDKSYFYKFQLLFYWGSYKLGIGEEGYGIVQLTEACKMAKIVFSTAEGAYYATCLTELAMAYNKAGCREEACECYKKVLRIYDTVEGHAFERHRILNNMGVMYLDWEKPEEALTCLEEAYRLGEWIWEDLRRRSRQIISRRRTGFWAAGRRSFAICRRRRPCWSSFTGARIRRWWMRKRG